MARILCIKTVTLAEARQSLSALVSEVEAFDEHVLITKNGRPTAVIVSADEWEAVEETALWRAVPGLKGDIDEARTEAGIELAAYVAQRGSETPSADG